MKNYFFKKIIIYIICAVFFLTVASSCAATQVYSEGNGELKVLCTTFAPFDFAKNVVGDRGKVSILQDGGSDLHNYTPTAATLQAISEADIFIYVGGTSDENWVDDAIAASGNKELVTLPLIEYVTPIHADLENDWQDHDHGHDHSNSVHNDHDSHDHGADEHIWTSPRNAVLLVTAICNALCDLDPQSAEDFKSNAKCYINRLNKLDSELIEICSDMQSTPLIFADRFPFVYLMHDYHLPYKAAFSGCTTEVNSSVATQVSLIEAVREYDIPAIITIEGGSKELAEAVAAETGCKILSLNSMQSVSRSDIIAGADYIEIMESNVSVLREVLKKCP